MPLNLPWLRKTDDKGKETLEVSLPDDVQKNLDKLKNFDPEKFTKLDEIHASLAAINARNAKEDSDRAEAQRRQQQQQQQQHQAETDEQIQELMLTDPAAATAMLIKKQTEPLANAHLNLRADSLRREVFEDADRFPYYTGELKSEIDKLIEAQSLSARNDRSVIENAYYATLGKKQKEISEGKLKDRFASAQGSRGTNGGNMKDGTTEEPPVVTDDVRRIAQMFGQKPEEYAKMLQDQGVGYV